MGIRLSGGASIPGAQPSDTQDKARGCTHSPTCHLPPPPTLRLPRECVPKQLTVRKVHEHGGTPTETGQDLTEQTSQRHLTHCQPKHTTVYGLHPLISVNLLSKISY